MTWKENVESLRFKDHTLRHAWDHSIWKVSMYSYYACMHLCCTQTGNLQVGSAQTGIISIVCRLGKPRRILLGSPRLMHVITCRCDCILDNNLKQDWKQLTWAKCSIAGCSCCNDSAFSLSCPLLLTIARREKRIFETSGGQDAGEAAYKLSIAMPVMLGSTFNCAASLVSSPS